MNAIHLVQQSVICACSHVDPLEGAWHCSHLRFPASSLLCCILCSGVVLFCSHKQEALKRTPTLSASDVWGKKENQFDIYVHDIMCPILKNICIYVHEIMSHMSSQGNAPLTYFEAIIQLIAI